MSTPFREVRKTVTMVFCDLVHSTGLAEGDPEAFRRVQWRYFETMRTIVERHGGVVEKFVGDEVMAVFGVPVVHEDDPLRAVRAAQEMRDAIDDLSDELEPSLGLRLEVRIGVNTGEVLAGDPERGQGFVAGEPVIVAKRLQQAAEPGEILIGKATYPLVQHAVTAGPLERIPVKGKRDEVGRRRLSEVDPEAPGRAHRLHGPIVGRADELQLLLDAFERVVAERSCRMFTLLGAPGIGKSRLAAELMGAVGDRAVAAVGRCLSYGEGITFWPLRDLLRGLGGEEALKDALAADEQGDAVIELLSGVIAPSDGAASTDEVFWAVRRAFEAFARRRPLVVCFDDVHWAEPALLDLVEYVVGWSRDAPILLLVCSRPELVEQRPQWIGPQASSDALALEPLSQDEMESLLTELASEAALPRETRERIVVAAEGNPLFVEQMSAMAEEGDGDGELPIPPTIQALLAERLDRLTADERELIERAAVVGREFPAAAVAGLSNEDQRASLSRHLFALVRRGLIRPDPAASAAEDRFTFQHILIRDVAYEAMPKELRANLHGRFAASLERLERGHELDELVGYHLGQAHRFRAELGMHGQETDRLGRRAGEFLASAGTRALGRNDVQAALKLLRRALSLLPDEDPAVALRLDLGQALFLSGQFAAAVEAAEETTSRAEAAGDDVGAFRARVLRARIRAQMPGEDGAAGGPSAELLAVAEEARPVFAQAGDELALAEAWFATAWAQLIRCRWAPMLDAVEHALEHARRAGSARWEGELPAWQGTAMFYGPMPVEEALGWYEAAQAQHPIALTQQAMLEAMRGEFDRARELAASADAAAEEFGQKLWLATGGIAVWEIEMLAGDARAAEAAVRRSFELLAELGETGNRWLAAGQVAMALHALGRWDEAEEWARAAEANAPEDDVSSQLLWRQVLAKLLARKGDHAEAERVAREALNLAGQTDMLNWHGNVLADAAEVAVLGGHGGEARRRLEQALFLYEQKGNVVAAERARRRLEDLTASVR